MEKQAKKSHKIHFSLKAATINLDDSGKYYHEFLVPDEGHSEIIKLHDTLYSDKFSPHLRFDIDFIPHIGIGNSDVVARSKQRIDALNAQDFQIDGTIEELSIIEYSNNSIRTVHQVELK